MTPRTQDLGERLIFIISPPRAGSTLLMRVLHATSSVCGMPEPHLIPPLAHLGFFGRVDQAPYDPVQTQKAQRDFVARLPRGTEDYIDACRAYTDLLYGRMLDAHGAGCRYLLDKTPANALVLPFLKRLYPTARYLVLTRHPAAIFASYANSFFDGDFAAAARFNPILERYIPPIARFLRDGTVPKHHVRYEDLASAPQASLERISAFLDIPLQPQALDYQRARVPTGLGDPLGVARHDRPVSTSVLAWVSDLAEDHDRFDVVARQLAGVAAKDLATWGTPTDTLWEPLWGPARERLKQEDPTSFARERRRWDRLSLQRRALVLIRRRIRERPHGRLIEKVRLACDVLLRGS